MFGSEILDVAIGLVLIYLLLSLVCSAVREGLEAIQKKRAVDLVRGVRELLNDRKGDGLSRDLFRHPLIHGLYRGSYQEASREPWYRGPRLPSYMPARLFATALMDLAARGRDPDDPSLATAGARTITLDGLRSTVVRLQNPPVQRAVLSAIDLAQGDLAQAQRNIEAWFDGAMQRVGGWYKRRSQTILFVLGLAVTILLNVNTLTVGRALYRDRTLREALVAEAGVVLQDTTGQTARAQQRVHQLDSLGLPIGWPYLPWPQARDTSRAPEAAGSAPAAWRWRWPPKAVSVPFLSAWLSYVFQSALGWLVTAAAISLGAPFWFDLLNKFMQVRSTVKPREEAPPAAPPQPPAPTATPTGLPASQRPRVDPAALARADPEYLAATNPEVGII